MKNLIIIIFLTPGICSCTRIIGQNTPRIWVVDEIVNDSIINAHAISENYFVYDLPCKIDVKKGDTIKVVDFGRKIYIRVTDENITNYNKIIKP